MITPLESGGVSHGRPIEVLNFEDDPADALIVERALRKVFLMSFQITTVQRLEEGLRWLREKSFDVALVDLRLRDAHGMETFERLRTEAPALPLIVLTGNDDDRLAVQILRQGAQDYLLKHETTGPLLAKAIRYAIERHRIRVELNSRALELEESLNEQKRAENRLAKILREKDVLLKEIHHRVKNNLQIISSLLNLQSRRIKDPQTLEIFRESCDRVQLMALIHEKLYGSVDLSQLDFTDYLHSLSAMILRSYANQSRNVKVEFRLHDQLHFSLDLAIPLGLIASELISNSLKHAFPRGGKGTITLELSEVDSDCTFCISDDGQGLPRNFSMEEPVSLGLRLVKLLAEQLEAQLTWSGAPGTSFTLTFRNRTKSKRIKYEPACVESA
jgi:two-component sensor histidine kinase/CheY-like chemotaxis protein